MSHNRANPILLTHYSFLGLNGLPTNASADDIHAARRETNLFLHPDKVTDWYIGGDKAFIAACAEACKRVNAAYEILEDAGKKGFYDMQVQNNLLRTTDEDRALYRTLTEARRIYALYVAATKGTSEDRIRYQNEKINTLEGRIQRLEAELNTARSTGNKHATTSASTPINSTEKARLERELREASQTITILRNELRQSTNTLTATQTELRAAQSAAQRLRQEQTENKAMIDSALRNARADQTALATKDSQINSLSRDLERATQAQARLNKTHEDDRQALTQANATITELEARIRVSEATNQALTERTRSLTEELEKSKQATAATQQMQQLYQQFLQMQQLFAAAGFNGQPAQPAAAQAAPETLVQDTEPQTQAAPASSAAQANTSPQTQQPLLPPTGLQRIFKLLDHKGSEDEFDALYLIFKDKDSATEFFNRYVQLSDYKQVANWAIKFTRTKSIHRHTAYFQHYQRSDRQAQNDPTTAIQDFANDYAGRILELSNYLPSSTPFRGEDLAVELFRMMGTSNEAMLANDPEAILYWDEDHGCEILPHQLPEPLKAKRAAFYSQTQRSTSDGPALYYIEYCSAGGMQQYFNNVTLIFATEAQAKKFETAANRLFGDNSCYKAETLSIQRVAMPYFDHLSSELSLFPNEFSQGVSTMCAVELGKRMLSTPCYMHYAFDILHKLSQQFDLSCVKHFYWDYNHNRPMPEKDIPTNVQNRTLPIDPALKPRIPYLTNIIKILHEQSVLISVRKLILVFGHKEFAEGFKDTLHELLRNNRNDLIIEKLSDPAHSTLLSYLHTHAEKLHIPGPILSFENFKKKGDSILIMGSTSPNLSPKDIYNAIANHFHLTNVKDIYWSNLHHCIAPENIVTQFSSRSQGGIFSDSNPGSAASPASNWTNPQP